MTVNGARGITLGVIDTPWPNDCPRIRGCGRNDASDLLVVECMEGGRVIDRRLFDE